ncbi:MAG: cadherin-like domain-containing protein [Proteobacteria bacterium]|nr:cadherin-like domain-containing protein [Pseudomonadota bacterium]MBU1056891.1 cadherin-like domain-containing protein [Pseudomonadota bacterium]
MIFFRYLILFFVVAALAFSMTPTGGAYDTGSSQKAIASDRQPSITALLQLLLSGIHKEILANDDGPYSVDEDEILTVVAPGVFANDLEKDAAPAVLVQNADHGSVSLAPAGSFTYTPNHNFWGADRFTYMISDGSYSSNIATVSLYVNPINDPPIANAGIDSSILVNETITLNGDGSSDPDNDLLTYAWTLTNTPPGSGATLTDTPSKTPSLTADKAGTYTIELVVNDGTLASAPDTVLITTVPPDPATLASEIDLSVATTTCTATEFLYTGDDPVQTDVAPDTIEARRAAVIRGKVLDRSNSPLSGVTITILDHPEFGRTLSRIDGLFDMAVNGGGSLTVKYTKSGYLPVQRQINVPWQDFTHAPDIVMIALDKEVTSINLALPRLQVARGSEITDSDGTRRATLLFRPGTAAELVLPDGSSHALTSLTVRATEYTVGENGPLAMPAEMPADVGYTYAVELSLDEAQAAGAKRVNFNQPVPFYVDNFLGFPIGGAVPLGYYDSDRAAWVPYKNGQVIKILTIDNGMAQLDTDGDNVVDNDPTLGITDDERSQLALLYPLAGKSLWRMQLSHFSTWDANWGWGGPPGAKPLQLNDQILGFLRDHHVGCIIGNCDQFGSVIESQNQTLGEAIALTATPFALHYRSDRVAGCKTTYTIKIPVSTDSIPPELKRIDLVISVAGRTFNYSLPADPNQTFPFTWDGKDAYGRVLQGTQPTRVRIGYVYDGYYQGVSQMLASFGYKGNGVPLDVNSRGEFIMWRDLNLSMGAYLFQDSAVGAWTPSMHHVYDPVGRMLYFGDGSRRSAQGVNEIMELVAGTGTAGFSGDGGPATSARINLPHDAVVAPDGSLFFADSVNSRVRKIDTDGTINTVMTGLTYPIGVTVGPDGSVYVAEYYGQRIKRLRLDGVVEIFAGTGTAGFSGDGGSPTAAQLNHPQGLAMGADGSLYIADAYNHRIRRVGPDGLIQTVAGTGETGAGTGGYGGDGGPATQALLNTPCRVHITADGSLYIADTYSHRIRKVATDGIISTVAGTGVAGYSGDNGPAIQAMINFPNGVSTSPDGSLYIAGYNNQRIRRVSPDGIITTVAGTGVAGSAGIGNPARQAQVSGPSGIPFATDGSYYISDRNSHRILRVRPPLPGFSNNDIAIPAEDGGLLYHFDAGGRHLGTVNSLTGSIVYQFTYDGAGRLTSVTDGDGNITTIERDTEGVPTAIVAPFGQRSSVSLDSNGYLNGITNPAGEHYQMSYTAEGLLTEFQDPRNYLSTMTYDDQGRLLKDQNAIDGFTELTRTENLDNYLVTSTSAEGRQSGYQVGFLGDGYQNRLNQFPDGSQSQLLIGADGSSRTTLADGTISTRVESSDPRFGMQAPVQKSLIITTGGLTSTRTSQRTVSLADVNDPMSLISQTDTTTLNGRTTSSVFAVSSRTRTVTSPMARQTRMTEDTQGRPVQVQVTGINDLGFSYDNQGQLVQIVQGARQSSLAYNPTTGYLASSSNPLNQITSYSRDAVGRITALIQPDTTTWSYEWDSMGNLTVLTEPNGSNQHRFTYTPINLLETYRSPLGAVERFSYNKDSQLTRREYPSGSGIDWLYNDKDQLTSVQTPEGNHSFSYSDTTGQLSQAISRDGQVVDYSYEGGLLSGSAWSGVVSGSVAYTYNNDLLVSQLQYGWATLPLSYDNDNLLTSIGTINLSRDADNGILTGLSDGDFQLGYGRNSFGEISSVTASQGATLYSATYSYDDLGRISQKVETIGGTSHSWDYVYDTVGQLTTVRRDSTTVESYGYDNVGNRTSINNSLTGDNLTATDFSYDADNKLQTAGTTTYSYDPDGRLNAVSGEHSYHYTTDGTLGSVDLADGRQITYQYDHLQRRVSRSVDGLRTHAWLYGQGLMPLVEYESDNSLRTLFIYDTGATPTTIIRNGTTYHIISDHLGSSRLVVDNSGTVVKELEYDSFGSVIGDTNPAFDLVFGFGGGMTDPDHELIRFGARDYQPSTGRWTSKDPILFNGGLHLFGYVGNDPINQMDRNGLKKLTEEEKNQIKINNAHPDSKLGRLNRAIACEMENTEEETTDTSCSKKKIKNSSCQDILKDRESESYKISCGGGICTIRVGDSVLTSIPEDISGYIKSLGPAG